MRKCLLVKSKSSIFSSIDTGAWYTSYCAWEPPHNRCGGRTLQVAAVDE